MSGDGEKLFGIQCAICYFCSTLITITELADERRLLKSVVRASQGKWLKLGSFKM